MFRVYRYKRDGTVELIIETRVKKEAQRQAKIEMSHFIHPDSIYYNDFDIVRVVIKQARKIILDKKEA